MTKIRKSDANFTGTGQYASFRLQGKQWRTAAKMCAEDAQKKIDARRAAREAEAATPSYACKHGQRSKYSPEFVAELVQIVEAGWSVSSTARMANIPLFTLRNWVNQTNRAPSVASICHPRRKKK